MTIAEQLKAWRKRKSYSQREAAESLGVSVRTLQNWEISRRRPQGMALAALREKLSVKQ